MRAGNGIEQSGLARTVRSDQSDDGALLDLEAYLVVGADAAKTLGDVE